MSLFGRKKECPYFTWGCADEFACRLQKTLYCGKENDFSDSSSVPLTDVAVSMVLDISTCSRRKLTHRYASSLTRQLLISPCALMMGILYTERLRQSNPCYLVRVSSADLYVVAMMVASKFLIDEGEDDEVLNDEWAEAAGLGVSTVNKLEYEFLDAMSWKIYVSPSEFLSFCGKVESKIALKCGLKRGWFSYTDLTQILLASKYQKVLSDILHNTVKVIASCVIMYGVSMSLLAISMTHVASNKNRITKLNQSEIDENYRYDECRVKHTLTHTSISLPSNGMLNASQESSNFHFQIKDHDRCTLHTSCRHSKCISEISTMDCLQNQSNRHQRNRYNILNSCRYPFKSLKSVHCEESNNSGKFCPTSPAPIQTFMSNYQVQVGNRRKHVFQYQLTIPKLLGIVI